MKIIDAHLHLPVNFSSFEEKKEALLSEMCTNKVANGIVISDSEIKSEIGSLYDCVNLFKGTPNIYVVGGISPFIHFEEQFSLIREYLKANQIVGIKIFSGHEPIYLDSILLKPIFEIAEEYNIPVLFHSGWDNSKYSAPKIVANSAKKYPNVKLVYCHCYYPKLNECFDQISNYNNVYFEVSSVADNSELCNSLKPILEKAIHLMPDRFIFGSDFGSCSQYEHISFFENLNLSDFEKKMFFADNAKKIYRI